MPDIDAINKQFMAEWLKRCESDPIKNFLIQSFRDGDQSVSSLRGAIEVLMAKRESEIKEQVSKEMKEKENVK